jgi:hypothetical protein
MILARLTKTKSEVGRIVLSAQTGFLYPFYVLNGSSAQCPNPWPAG